MMTNTNFSNELKPTGNSISRGLRRILAKSVCWIAALAFFAAVAIAQAPARSDGQIETDVVRAIDNSKALKNETITAATISGEVTLTGTVTSESARELAEIVVGKVEGVVSVDNKLQLKGEPVQPVQSQPAPQPAPQMESMTPAETAQIQSQASDPQPPHVALPPADADAANQGAVTPTVANPQQMDANAQPQPQSQPMPADSNQPNPQVAQNSAQSPRPEYIPNAPANNPSNNQANNPNNAPQQDAQQGPSNNPPAQLLAANAAPLTVPEGTLLQLRTNESLDSKRAQKGTMFELTVIHDVFVAGKLAIPRGATVHGVVVETKQSGDLGGAPTLALQLQSLDLGGQQYALASDEFKVRGPNKAGYSASNIIGGAGFGAIIGGIIGRGPGAAIGAVAGGTTGAVVSGATPGPRAWIPAEALVTFHLTQPVTVAPVSHEEALRLAQGLFPGGPTLYTRGPGGPGPYAYGEPLPFYHPYYAVGGVYYWR